jgi:alkanesulfonate monooxygenase SsuD/methylene tetrahydromethanopterin reductase-like flavin-dependent oxidoreductase (luciferase family)
MAATLQHLSGGRFIMALGAGWKEDEYRAYGYDFPRPGVRVEQLEDTLEIVRRMWTQPGQVSYQGKHYHITDAWCEPKPDPVPTLIVGGKGERVLRLAARYADWYNAPDKSLTAYAALVETLRQQCAAVGRDFASIRKTWFGRIVVAHTEEAAVKLSGGRWTRERAIVGSPEQVIAQIRAFQDLGVDYFMAEFPGQNDPASLDLLRDVLAEARS